MKYLLLETYITDVSNGEYQQFIEFDSFEEAVKHREQLEIEAKTSLWGRNRIYVSIYEIGQALEVTQIVIPEENVR